MSDVDHGIAAGIGAAVVGAGAALKRLLSGKDGPTREEFEQLKNEVTIMKDVIGECSRELKRLNESNDQRDEQVDALRMTSVRLETIIERMERLERRKEN